MYKDDSFCGQHTNTTEFTLLELCRCPLICKLNNTKTSISLKLYDIPFNYVLNPSPKIV